MRPNYYNDWAQENDSYEMEERRYERYNGSYAQDLEGCSNQDIYDVFN